MRRAFRQLGGHLSGSLRSIVFPGPAGRIEGLWKDASGSRRGSAVVAHPHPLHGGTMHSKVVYRAALALTGSGYATLRFNFRGVGLSEGRYDGGRGEVEDYRAALDEAERAEGLPIIAAGFSFGAASALESIAGDSRIQASIALGLPVATETGQRVPRPAVPALYVVGEKDTFGPPVELERFLGGTGRIVVVPGADHFFEGALDTLGGILAEFLGELPHGDRQSEAS